VKADKGAAVDGVGRSVSQLILFGIFEWHESRSFKGVFFLHVHPSFRLRAIMASCSIGAPL